MSKYQVVYKSILDQLQKLRREFKFQGVPPEKLLSATQQQIAQRILTEEATLGLTKAKPVKDEDASDEDSIDEGR